jgi:hypothetical protein
MSKVIVAYTIAGLSLFGGLFSALALSGVIRPGPTVQEIAEAEAAVVPQLPPPSVYTPPSLDSDRFYKLSHETPIYSAAAQSETDREDLKPGQYFRVVQTLEEPQGPWFEIQVTEGPHVKTMYLYGMDLRWKTLTKQYTDDETAQMEQEARLQWRKEVGLVRRREPVIEAPPPPEPQAFDEWWAEAGQRMGGPTTANLIASAGAAGVVTVLILGSIALLSVLRREHTWSRPGMHGDIDALPPEDDPFTYSYGTQQNTDDYDGQSGEDQPRA